MEIEDWSDDAVVVNLGQEPEMGDELARVAEIVRDKQDCDVIIDFSDVDIVTSSRLSKLLKLRKLLMEYGRRLTFRNVKGTTRGILAVTGLDGLFELVDDKSVVLAGKGGK
jgi:anti-anti-sigma regulatory factor